MARKRMISATINGRLEEFLCTPRQTLLEVLRDVLGLTGTKEGCSNGNCGACTVLLDGRPVDSCLVLAVEIEGCRLETIEGLAEADRLHPLQQAFLEARGPAVRHLHTRLSHVCQGAARRTSRTVRRGHSLRSGRQSLPLYGLR